MRVLIDTHAWIWMRTSPQKLSARTRRMLLDARTEILLSAVTPWEIAIKVAIGKLRLPAPVEEFVTTRSAATRVTPLPITQLHAMESAALPLHHRDPFDRVLIAQARSERVAIVTSDDAFDAYDVEVIAAQ